MGKKYTWVFRLQGKGRQWLHKNWRGEPTACKMALWQVRWKPSPFRNVETSWSPRALAVALTSCILEEFQASKQPFPESGKYLLLLGFYLHPSSWGFWSDSNNLWCCFYQAWFRCWEQLWGYPLPLILKFWPGATEYNIYWFLLLKPFWTGQGRQVSVFNATVLIGKHAQ